MSWSKFFCLLVFGLLLVTSFAVNSFGTVTLSDSGIVDDSLGMVLSFDGDWMDDHFVTKGVVENNIGDDI